MVALNEENLANALDALSPSDVQESPRLFASFRAFFTRGSPREFQKFLPNPGAVSSDKSGPDPLCQCFKDSQNSQNIDAPKNQKSKTSGYKRKLSGVALHRSKSIERNSFTLQIQEAREFFAAKISLPAELDRLMRVFEGVLKAPRHTAYFYLGLWSAHRSCVFDTAGAMQSRIARLFQGRKLIEQESQRFEFAGRLSLIFLTHDVEIIKAQDWKLAPGQSRQHAAVSSIAQHLNLNPEEIKKEWRRSRNYIRLLEECGPASLLELGTGVNW
ncbi:hypothetical protein N7495_002316 [Penicillium taxi]|uniref:uncharacterized protein n=1 Tax=Penicillium taxi TaxID=168475 RepID=UPI002544E3C8|nr:uncharacterized protein N7495_002316 [Penicillium taxi]KAJ5901788.1 hypothetical protein N7495_002316 [Penicillium taxi]